MANRRNGSSWSLFGEGEVYRKKVDPFEAIYGVRKEEIKGIYQTKGMACSVYVKKDEKEVAHFVTWSGVTRDLLNKPAQVNCFSSQHFHTAPVDSNSTVETFGHFSFLPAGPIFASLSSKKFIVAFKPLEQEEDLKAYYFVGSEKLTLKLDTKTHKLVTFSEEDRQKLELSPSSVLGAPIIGKNKNISSHNGGRWCVVGVVGLSREGELCPHFVTSEIFEQPGPTCSDAVQPPISQTPENSTNPPGGEAVDASGQPGLSDAVQPPISQTPENSTNPPGGEAVDASGMDSKMKRRGKEETASEISGDEMSLSAVADRLMKIVISAQDLEGEKLEDFCEMLTAQVKFLEKYHHYSTNTANGVAKLIDHLEQAFQLLLRTVDVSSLVIIVDCQTLKGLDHLWNDYLSGHLNTMAEQCLVTDEMKQKLGLETISLKTTIDKENYLICRKFLTQIPGEAESALLSCQHGLLDQGSCTKEMNTSAGYTAVSRSALHRASINGQYEEVNMHLKSGANVDERDQFLLTPLHLACWYGHESVVKLLLDHNADVNALDRFQFTPLQKAERWNHQSIIQLLLDHDAKPSFLQPLSLKTFAKRAFLRADSLSGFNVLQTVVLQVDDDIVCQASTVLDYFVEEMQWITIKKPRHPRIEKLYKTLVDIDETINELHLCAKSGDVEKVIELVLNDGMDVNVAAKNNITPLLWASTMSSGVLIKTLIDLGADVNAQTAPGKQGPLLFAVSNNNYVVARFLLEHGAEANIQDKNGEAPLHKAATQNDPALFKLLLENKAGVNIQGQKGETPLHKAVFDEDIPLVKLLLENKATVNIKAKNGEAPLHKAATQNDPALFKLLLQNKADANIQDQKGETPLHKAVFDEDIPFVELLLQNKADANIQDRKGETPLQKAAVTRENVRLVELLLENKADANIQGQKGETLLHKAVFDENIPFVKLLLQNKADANIQDQKGETPLHKAAVKRENVRLVKLLLENKGDVNIQDRVGETPLHKAVFQEDIDIVKLLLGNKADVNIRDQEGKTPLRKAVRWKSKPLVNLLLENKADANIQDEMGEAPLHKAVSQNDKPLVMLLLEKKADANIQDQLGNTPLHLCARYGFSDTSQMLIEFGCNINLRNKKGETPSDIQTSRRQ
ncbi:ankyrin-1-like [Montipora capricornis]|uniref:ankyrin-1-like n=1 Tax=Montipora capricornis TaxID=246305 RepID=UPI0035F169EE